MNKEVYIKIPNEFYVLNGKIKRYVLKRGAYSYVILQEGQTRYPYIVMERILRGTTELLSDYQRYKACMNRAEAERIFQSVEWGELEF